MLKRYTLLHIFTIVKSILRKSRYTCNHGSPYGHKYLKEEQSMKKTNIGFAVTVVLILCLTIFVGCKSHGSKKGHAFALDYISESLELSEAQKLHLANIKDEIQSKLDLLHKEKAHLLPCFCLCHRHTGCKFFLTHIVCI